MTTEQAPCGDEDCELQVKAADKAGKWTASED